MSEGLVIDLSVSQAKAEKQIDDFVAKQKAKLSKLEATVTIKTVHTGGGWSSGGFRSSGGGGNSGGFRGLSGAFSAMGDADARRKAEREEEQSAKRQEARQERQANRYRESQQKLQQDLQRINERARVHISRIEKQYGDESIRGVQLRADAERRAIEQTFDARRRAVLRNAKIEKEAIDETQKRLTELKSQEDAAKSRTSRRETERLEPLQKKKDEDDERKKQEREEKRVAREERSRDRELAARLDAERRNAMAIHDVIESNQRNIDKIRSDSLRKFAQVGPQNDVLMQRALGFDANAAEKALAGQRRVNAARLAETQQTIAKILAIEAKARHVPERSVFEVHSSKKFGDRAINTERFGSGTRAGSQAQARFNSQLFQVQQAFEDFQYAGFRGLSNNVAFLSANLKNAKLAAAGLWSVIALGVADSLGVFDKLIERLTKMQREVGKLSDLALKKMDSEENTLLGLAKNPPKSADDAAADFWGTKQRFEVEQKITAEYSAQLTRAREAAQYLSGLSEQRMARVLLGAKGLQGAGDRNAEDDAAFLAMRTLREAGMIGKDQTDFGPGSGIADLLEKLKKAEMDRAIEAARTTAEYKAQAKFLYEMMNSPQQKAKDAERLERQMRLDPKQAALMDEKGPLVEQHRRLDALLDQINEKYRLLERLVESGAITHKQFLERAAELDKEAEKHAAALKDVNRELEFAKELERARKDLKREQVDAEREQISILKQQQRENESLIEQERKKAEAARRNAVDSRYGFESRQFDTGRGLTQRFTDRQHQYAKGMDQAQYWYLRPSVREARDAAIDQAFAKLAYDRDQNLVNNRIGQLKGQASAAGKAGDFERQRKLYEELQSLQLDVASNDPSMYRASQMFQDAGKTQKLIEKAFEQEAQRAEQEALRLEQANQGLTNQMGTLEEAVRELEAAIRGVPEKAREQARREAEGNHPADLPRDRGLGRGAVAGGGLGGGLGAAAAGGDGAALAGGALDPDDVPPGKPLPPRLARAKAIKEQAAKRAEQAAQARGKMHDKIRAAAEKHRELIDKKFGRGDLPATAEIPGSKEPFRYTKKPHDGKIDPGVVDWMKDKKYRDFLAGGSPFDRTDGEMSILRGAQGRRDRAAEIRRNMAAKDPDVAQIKANTQRQSQVAENSDRTLKAVENQLRGIAAGLREPRNIITNNFFSGGQPRGGAGVPVGGGFIPNIPQGPINPRTGAPLAFSGGARVPGHGFHDSVAAMLTPGEVVLNARQQNKLGQMLGSHPSILFGAAGVPGFSGRGSYSGVAGNFMPYTSPARFADGGIVQSVATTTNTRTNFGGVTINVKSVDDASAMMARMRTEQRAALIRRGAR